MVHAASLSGVIAVTVNLEPGPTLREQVVERLKFAVLTGEFEFGRTYSVPALADQFGISATPMREAVLDLVKEHLLFTVPGRGFQLQRDPIDVVVAIAEARRLIEIPVTIEAAEHMCTADLDALRALADALSAHAADHDVPQYLRAELEFHQRIIDLHPNRELFVVVEYLQARARLHALPFAEEPGVFIEPSSQHHALIDALEHHDVEAIRAVVDQHIHFAVIAAAHPYTSLATSAG